MMGKGTWACFHCRETVRRPTQYAADVPCPTCGHPCKYLGTKVAVPSKSSTRAWQQLRVWLSQQNTVAQERAQIAKVRWRHRLEKEIARLEALPKNEGRAIRLRLLRARLAKIG